MKRDKVLITGSSGLIGSESVKHFLNKECEVIGIDNNNRCLWFGFDASITSTSHKLSCLTNFKHYFTDIMDAKTNKLIKEFKPDLIIHCAAQPSHEKSSKIPVTTFEVNTLGTVKMLERTRKHVPNATFVFLSTNKVYQFEGVRTPFGATKYAADIMVQEYGNYFGMKTVCFRCGCITGIAQKGVEQHGFLNYLTKCVKEEKEYTIYGFEGNQIRDNLHALDVAKAIEIFHQNPKSGAVYDLGGGKENACTLLESIKAIEKRLNKKLKTKFGPTRKGDFENWITDNSDFIRDYNWKPSISLDQIFDELISNETFP